MKNKIFFIGALTGILSGMLQITCHAQRSSAIPLPQAPYFNYDAAGNRILRYYGALKHLNKNTDTTDEEARQIAEQNGILVYPNPVENDYVNVSLSTFNSEEPATLSILDNAGKALVSQKALSPVTRFNFAGYTSGIYYIQVLAGKEELFYKIVKTE
jgi:Secretion system C-terminal sorting domain